MLIIIARRDSDDAPCYLSFTVKQLSLVLGQDFSDADFQLCIDHIYSLEPKVRKFWQS